MFSFLTDLLSECSIHYWKWGVEILYYYCVVVLGATRNPMCASSLSALLIHVKQIPVPQAVLQKNQNTGCTFNSSSSFLREKSQVVYLLITLSHVSPIKLPSALLCFQCSPTSKLCEFHQCPEWGETHTISLSSPPKSQNVGGMLPFSLSPWSCVLGHSLLALSCTSLVEGWCE